MIQPSPTGPRAEPEEVTSLRMRYVVAVREATRRVFAGRPSADGAEQVAAIAADFADREVETWRQADLSPKDLACREGCSSCCHVPIAATVPEVIRIAMAILDDHGPGELALLRDGIERHRQAVSGARRVGPGRVMHPCPFLDDGRCSIYEIRPLICRGWSSRDVERCEAYHADPLRDAGIPIDGIQHTIAGGIALGIQDALRSSGLDDRPVELVPAIRIVLDDPGAVARWLGGEPAFREAEFAPADPDVYQIGGLVARPTTAAPD